MSNSLSFSSLSDFSSVFSVVVVSRISLHASLYTRTTLSLALALSLISLTLSLSSCLAFLCVVCSHVCVCLFRCVWVCVWGVFLFVWACVLECNASLCLLYFGVCVSLRELEDVFSKNISVRTRMMVNCARKQLHSTQHGKTHQV